MPLLTRNERIRPKQPNHRIHLKGISAKSLVELSSVGSGVGLRGMRERARQFGGELNIVQMCTALWSLRVFQSQRPRSGQCSEHLLVHRLLLSQFTIIPSLFYGA
jgi:hypothetical protein